MNNIHWICLTIILCTLILTVAMSQDEHEENEHCLNDNYCLSEEKAVNQYIQTLMDQREFELDVGIDLILDQEMDAFNNKTHE